MKLAEALLWRADQQKKLASLRERIARNALVQEGETPSEGVESLLAEAFALMYSYEQNVLRINAANQRSTLPDGRQLAAVLAARDTLVRRHSLMVAAIEATHREVDRYSQREIKWVPQINVAAFQKQADDLARQIRELNVAIQAANWQIEIE